MYIEFDSFDFVDGSCEVFVDRLDLKIESYYFVNKSID